MKAGSDMLIATVAIVAGWAVVAGFVHYQLLPTVQVSTRSGDCVRVISEDPAASCDQLPGRYRLVYVE